MPAREDAPQAEGPPRPLRARVDGALASTLTLFPASLGTWGWVST